MQKIPQEQAKKRYFSLSDSLQNAMFSEKSSDAVRKTAIFGNIENKVSRLAELTGYVLLGYLNPIDFSKEIQEEFNISRETAEQIASQLDAEIFSLVDSDLRKLYPPRIKTPTAISGGFIPDQNKPSDNSNERTPEKKFSEFEKRFLKDKTASSEPTPKKNHLETRSTNDWKPGLQTRKEMQAGEKPIQAPSFKNAPRNQKPLENEAPKSTSYAPIGASGGKPKPIENAEDIPEIKPVIPLPTFMQSQFQPRKKLDESDYKENIPAPVKKSEDEEDKKPQPKIEGNIIDLRDL